jgi:hypothetical protein
VEAGLGDNVNLDGGVATRVVDGACVNLRDPHCGFEGTLKPRQQSQCFDCGVIMSSRKGSCFGVFSERMNKSLGECRDACMT